MEFCFIVLKMSYMLLGNRQIVNQPLGFEKKIHSTSKDGSSTFTGLVIFEIGSSITGVSKMMRRMSLVSTIEYLIRHGIHVCKFTKNHVSMPSPEWAWNRLALPIPPRTSAGGQGAACVCEFAEITGKDGLYMNLRFIMDCSPPTQLLKTHHGLLTPKARNHSVQRQQRKKLTTLAEESWSEPSSWNA